MNDWETGEKPGKQGGKTQAADCFSLDTKCFRDFLKCYCRDFFGTRPMAVLSAIQAYHYFTEYLLARGHLDGVQASRLQTAAAVDFESMQKLIGASDPIYRIYPTYERLISGVRFHSEP